MEKCALPARYWTKNFTKTNSFESTDKAQLYSKPLVPQNVVLSGGRVFKRGDPVTVRSLGFGCYPRVKDVLMKGKMGTCRQAYRERIWHRRREGRWGDTGKGSHHKPRRTWSESFLYSPQRDPVLPTPWSPASSPIYCETIRLGYLSHPVYGICCGSHGK